MRKNTYLSCNHTHHLNETLTASFMRVFSLGAVAHLITHLVPTILIFFGLSEIAHTHNHSTGLLLVESFLLSELAHILLFILIVYIERIRST